jgi:hypothetical protein
MNLRDTLYNAEVLAAYGLNTLLNKPLFHRVDGHMYKTHPRNCQLARTEHEWKTGLPKHTLLEQVTSEKITMKNSIPSTEQNVLTRPAST